ncbi:MAG: GGDEF domain-containing protein [Desulfobacterales bacterium]
MKEKNRKRIRKQLTKVLEEKPFDIDLISAYAGDRNLTKKEKECLKKLKSQPNEQFFVNLLFTLTHQYFPRENAQILWEDMVQHKKRLEKTLGRKVGISVAAMDYMTNIKDTLEKPVIVSKVKMSEIAEVALTDGLTKLFDSTAFRNKLEVEIKRFKRYKSEVSLIMLDIDDFKKVNDLHGHQKGDRVLIDVALLILKVSRELDICSRYGGEEFTIILPHTNLQDALKIAERLRKIIEKYFKSGLKITASIGVANCPSHAKLANALIKKADKALYNAKNEGKNRVSVLQ